MESRLSDFVWVRRRLRRFKALKTADFYRAYGFVHKNAEPVIADQVLSDRKHARERNAKTLQNTIIYNKADMDEWLTLFSVSAASVSNPELRRIEMMVRLKGFEALADKAGHQALFLTFTTPSRFHAYHSAGAVNDKWLDADKPTVKAASDWLTSAWAEIRTDLKDAGIRVYGFRFVEPHHDGCPHWHLVLFMEPEHCQPLISICRDLYYRQMIPILKKLAPLFAVLKLNTATKTKALLLLIALHTLQKILMVNRSIHMTKRISQ